MLVSPSHNPRTPAFLASSKEPRTISRSRFDWSPIHHSSFLLSVGGVGVYGPAFGVVNAALAEVVSYAILVYAKTPSNFGYWNAVSVIRANLVDLPVRHFTRNPSASSASLDHIVHIVLVCTRRKVVWIYAAWVVAPVPNQVTFWDAPDKFLI